MTKITRTLLASMVLFTLLLASCGEDEVNPTSTVVDSTVFPEPNDAFGILAAIKTFTEQSTPVGNIDIEFGTAVAAFIDGSNFFAAGTVNCNTEELTQNANNSYVHIPSPTSPNVATGIDFSSGTASWDVDGSSDVPAITKSLTGFPSKPVITSASSVNTAESYTFEWTGGAGNGTDSLIISIFGSSDGASKTVVAGTTSVTFSSADMSGVGTTENGVLQVAAYKIQQEVVDGKNIYLINESVGSETGVSIQ